MASEDVHAPASVAPDRRQDLLLRTLAIYRQAWAETPHPREWLARIGVVDCALLEHYQVGYCAGRLREILPCHGDLWAELTSVGVLGTDGIESLSGCVVVPVFGPEGHLLSLCGIAVDGAWPPLEAVLPGSQPCVWNTGAGRTYPELLVAEHVLGGLCLAAAGCDNVIVPVPAGQFPGPDAEFLVECGARALVFLDDERGTAPPTESGLGRLGHRIVLQAAAFPEGQSPARYLCDNGPDALAALVRDLERRPIEARQSGGRQGRSEAGVGIAWCGEGGFRAGYGPRSYEVLGLRKNPSKLKATVRLEQGGRFHVDTLDLYRARARRAFCRDAARLLDQPLAQIEADLARLIRDCEAFEPAPNAEVSRDLAGEMTPEDRREAEQFGRDPDLVERIVRDYEQCGIVGERHGKLLCYLAAVSRKLPEPLSVLILSSSGAGKSALQNATLTLCPPEDVIKLTSLTGKALYYKDELSLQHRVLALEEEAGAEDAAYAVRSLISSGELIIESTVRDSVTGRLRAMANRVRGPTAVFYTTTNPDVDPETRSRFFTIGIDESREQTRRILELQRRREASRPGARERILRRHRNFQRLLRPVCVVNPFAPQLSFDDHRLQARRDQPKYLSLIAAAAFLRQMSKRVHEPREATEGARSWVEVDLTDISIANELANETMGRSLDELSVPSRDLLALLENMTAARRQEHSGAVSDEALVFTRRQIREFSGWSTWRIHAYLRELVDGEYVLRVSGRRGIRFCYQLAYEGQGKDGSRFVLGLKSVDELARRREA